jgi:hypothetical protein
VLAALKLAQMLLLLLACPYQPALLLLPLMLGLCRLGLPRVAAPPCCAQRSTACDGSGCPAQAAPANKAELIGLDHSRMLVTYSFIACNHGGNHLAQATRHCSDRDRQQHADSTGKLFTVTTAE